MEFIETPAFERAKRDLLDEDDREIILLRHTEQMGNQEAADFLGLSPAAAGMRHTRALRRLKDVLTEKSADSIP